LYIDLRPTPLNKTKDPDVSYILAAVTEIKIPTPRPTGNPGINHLSRNYEELIMPILEENGLKVGKDIFLAFSPERVDPGNLNTARTTRQKSSEA